MTLIWENPYQLQIHLGCCQKRLPALTWFFTLLEPLATTRALPPNPSIFFCH